MGAHILVTEGLTKKFGDFLAVDHVDFAVEEGEVFGLLGPNGAGKTTTISMLTGIIPPTAGTARVGGFDLRQDLSEVKKINGLVPQELALYPALSARANLNFFGRIYGLQGKALRQRVDDVLSIVSLADRADEPVKNFSGGMKRRVNIAAGLVHQPQLLFLDEPTVGVDPQSRNHIFESVLSLNRARGMSIIYTSHYMEEVELLCNRVAIIDQGRIIALDTVKNLIAILGGGILQIELARADAQLLTDLGALGEVKKVSRQSEAPKEEGAPAGNPVLSVECENHQKALVNVIGYLNDHQHPILSLDILEPNLESVFLHLTGKKLRE